MVHDDRNVVVRLVERRTGGLTLRDAEKARRFNLFFWVVALLVLLGLVGGTLREAGRLFALAVPFAAFLALFPVYFWTSADYPRRFRSGSHLLTGLLLIVLATGPALFDGGLSSPDTIYLVLAPLCAGVLFLEIRTTLVWVGATLLAFVFVVVVGGMLGEPPGPAPSAADRMDAGVTVTALYLILVGGTLLHVSRSRLRETEAARTVAENARLAAEAARAEAEEGKAEAELVSAGLARARDEAEHANEATGRFLADWGHEMRTPLSVVYGMADVLSQTELDANQQRVLGSIRASSETLLTLVDDVLDLAKVDSGHSGGERTAFDFHALVEDAVAVHAEAAQSKGLELACLIDSDVPNAVEGDPSRLRQVLANLLDNAIKFTREGEVVVIAALAEEVEFEGADYPARARVRIQVIDTGIGMNPAEQDRIFDVFGQPGGTVPGGRGGGGLGLAMAKHLVEHMGGKVGVNSTPGAGATFWFDVPLYTRRREKHAAPLIPTVDHQEARVLVVHENWAVKTALTTRFEAFGLTVEVVSEPAALDQIRAHRRTGRDYAIVVLDTQTRREAAIETAVRIRSDPGSFGRPGLVFLTPAHETIEQSRLDVLGLSASVRKPLRTNRLREIVASLLAGESKPQPAGPSAADAGIPDHVVRQLRGKAVLLAEDNTENRELAELYLSILGCRTLTAHDGEEAVARFREADAVDAVLMDGQMPLLDGYQATERIRRLESEAGVHTPIIALTASAFASERAACLAAGMDGVLTKPYTVEELGTALYEALTRRSPERRSPS